MTDLRTAAQQALEALETGGWNMTTRAITALRAALARQDEPQGCATEEDCTKQPWCRMLGECQRKQAEPVGPRWEGDDNITSPWNACMHKNYCVALKEEREYWLAQQAEPVPVAWSGYDLDGMVEAFSRVIEAHHSSKHPFQNPIDMDAQMALRVLRGFIPAMKAYAAPPQQAEPVEPVAWVLDGTSVVEFDRQTYHNGPEWTPLCKCSDGVGGVDGALANARLIAAAPLLYEALQDLCDTLGECGMTEKARAAIKAVEGETK